MRYINEVMNNKEKNYIFPFLWLHGEDEKTLRQYIGAIQESGIEALCIESRPHPDFLGEKWWEDLSIILDEAKKRHMKVWILDDSHFPTGYANGAVEKDYPELRKRYLKLQLLDFMGPMKSAQAILKYGFRSAEDQLEKVYLAKKIDYDTIDIDTIIDITENVQEDLVSFDLPEGEWRLLVLISTYEGGEKETENYLNPIDPKGTDVLLKTVYEAHYEHFKEEFGQTIAGFFSDEPRLGNVHGAFGSIGRLDMVLPWRKDMAACLSNRIGEEAESLLPLLFIDGNKKSHEVRFHYMDLVSDLYSENFNGRIASWCHEHGVEYIGHTIEDNNAHARLGYGTGHFFKAMAHQDMSGIDVVLHQLMPGMDHHINKAMTRSGWDGEFFHYVLGKLGSSLAHIDPKKQGRTMCEVFGAYGWAEGNRFMKWIQDYMLVRGVNNFVPHAFSGKDYPDPDCPPHFFAHGKNPQFGPFRELMKYTNRMSHLLSDGIHRAPIALSYHGEAEWSGDYMLMQKPAAVLTRAQLDFDILPVNELCQASQDEEGIHVNQEYYKALVIPYAEALPKRYLETLLSWAENGQCIVFVDQLPKRSSEGENVQAILDALKKNKSVHSLSLSELVSLLEPFADLQSSEDTPYLRYYHYEHEDGDVYMITNEHPYQTIDTRIRTSCRGKHYWYDGMENKSLIDRQDQENQEEKQEKEGIHLVLSPYESKVLVYPKNSQLPEDIVEGSFVYESKKKIEGPYQVSFSKFDRADEFEDEQLIDRLAPLQELIPSKTNFAGKICYKMTFDSAKDKDKDYALLIQGVSESSQVILNGQDLGVKICPPHRYDVTKALVEGENKMEIYMTTTLVREQRDFLSQFMLVEPLGITGSIEIQVAK